MLLVFVWFAIYMLLLCVCILYMVQSESFWRGLYLSIKNCSLKKTTKQNLYSCQYIFTLVTNMAYTSIKVLFLSFEGNIYNVKMYQLRKNFLKSV